MTKKKCLIVFGTRPEAIKMAPIIKLLKKESKYFETKICITAQHRHMLDQVLSFFNISIDYDLDLMKPNQNLYSLTADIIQALKIPLEEFNPDYVFVHGDTTTSMAAALAGFYNGSKICHIEAGLRTHDKLSPFPEEVNRQITSRIADYHFAPTRESRDNLLKENIDPDSIVITGNTVIDALLTSKNKIKSYSNEEIVELEKIVKENSRIVLVTGHRRENHGDNFIAICESLKELARQHDDVTLIYPVHLNPKVLDPVTNILKGIKNIKLIAPLSYPSFVWLMDKSYMILTDSGGVQEEAPSLGKPVLVLRDTTERPEAVSAGTVILVGANSDQIIKTSNQLLNDPAFYSKMSSINNPYGDGKASARIVEYLKSLN